MSFFEMPYSGGVSKFSQNCVMKFIKEKGQPSIIVLCGPVGTGKTYDACGLAKHTCRHKGFTRFMPCSVLYNCDSDDIDAMMRCRALVLDDYGSRQTEGSLMRALELVDYRMHKDNAVTIMTTNLIKEIRNFDERMASRLNTACVINFKGKKDRRLEGYKCKTK